VILKLLLATLIWLAPLGRVSRCLLARRERHGVMTLYGMYAAFEKSPDTVAN
jgi:hypothetical protein